MERNESFLFQWKTGIGFVEVSGLKNRTCELEYQWTGIPEFSESTGGLKSMSPSTDVRKEQFRVY